MYDKGYIQTIQYFRAGYNKFNLDNTRVVTRNRVTSGGTYLRNLAPGQHSFKETSQRWRAVVDCV